MDTLTPERRSEVMGRIRSFGTGPETAMRTALIAALPTRALRAMREHLKDVPGRPDFAFPSRRVAVFVEGCFFHGCPRHYKRPKSNRAFWDRKLRDNVRRDGRNRRALWAMGWRVVRAWECRVRADPAGQAARVAAACSRGR